MPASLPPLARATAALAAFLLLVPPAARAGASSPWQVTRARVRVVCPLTVGGSFEATTDALTGQLTPGPAGAPLAGELRVDLRTLDTGIDLRTHHMKENYLEVDKAEGWAEATLDEVRLGEGDPSTVNGRTAFTGRLRVHGESRPVKGTAEVKREGGSVHVEASFPVTVAEYGIPKPQYLGVGVREVVEVKVSLWAAPAAGEGR